MEIGIFCFDGCDLYWMDEGERGDLDLEFDSLEDAVWAQYVWANFIEGIPGEPELKIADSGHIIVMKRRKDEQGKPKTTNKTRPKKSKTEQMAQAR